jgi:hypothetical protein
LSPFGASCGKGEKKVIVEKGETWKPNGDNKLRKEVHATTK